MKVNPNMFRGYDLRGVVNQDLNSEIVEHIGKAYGTFLNKERIKTAVVGHDCRLTSGEYSEALIRGIVSTGIDVVNIGLTIVGNFYWSQYHLNIKGGAMVTASHNPAEYNGFKFAVDFSETMSGDQIQELRKIIEKESYIKTEAIGKTKKQNITEAYFNDIVMRVNIAKKFKIVVDPSNSTPGAFIPDLLERAGCEVIKYNCKLDGSFPMGTPDPTEKEVAERLSEEVIKEKADMGFSYDADGDRIGIVDEKGEIIWNDVLVALLAVSILERHPGATIMYNTLCSRVVEDVIKEKGGKPFMWRTGHGFLKKKNQEVKAAFIGELSGHFFFSADFYNHDDASYTTLSLLEYLSKTEQTLSQAVEVLPKYISSPEIKVGCSDDLKVALIGKLSQKLKIDWPQAKIIDDERAGDGARLDMEDSMFVIRYSQNGPYLTIKFEAKTKEKYNELKIYIRQLLYSYSEVDWSFGVNVAAIE